MWRSTPGQPAAHARGGFKLAVELDVTLPGISDAHRGGRGREGRPSGRPYSNATRGNIEVTLTANGVAVD